MFYVPSLVGMASRRDVLPPFESDLRVALWQGSYTYSALDKSRSLYCNRSRDLPRRLKARQSKGFILI